MNPLQAVINIDVDDLDRATHFYRATFGLKIGRRFGLDGVELLGSSAPIFLLVKAAGTTPTSASTAGRCYDRHWTPVHLDFLVEEIESAVRNAINAGARLESPVSHHPWGKLALMADPFGHGFCFIQFLGRGYDEIAE